MLEVDYMHRSAFSTIHFHFVEMRRTGFCSLEMGRLAPPAALRNTAFAPALFACMLKQAFARARTARRYGIKTPGPALLPIRGLVRLG